MKEIPRKNYLIYLGVCLATFLLLFLFINRVRTMNIEKKSVLTGFLYEITDNNILDNLESYAIDNSNFFLYISNHNNSSDFDMEFKQFIIDYSLKDNVIYLNGWNKLSSNFVKSFKGRMFGSDLNDVSIIALRQSNIYEFKNGKVARILYNQKEKINMSDVRIFMNEVIAND